MIAEPSPATGAGRGTVDRDCTSRRRRRWRIGVVAIAGLFATAAMAGTPAVRLVGSDLLGPGFTAAVRDYAQRNELALSLALEGSRSAIAEVSAGRADIALVALRPEEKPPAAAYRSLPFAYFTTFVLVPDSLPVTQLTFGQLAGIFGANAGASYTRWGELGATGDAMSRAIEPEAMTAGSGLALEVFRHLVLADGALKSTVVRQASVADLLRKLSAESGGGIALAGALPEQAQGIRALLVARGDQDVAFGPTPENVNAGDYPLRLTLWLVVRRDFARDGGLDFLRFLTGDEIAATVERAGLVPPPAQARRQAAFDLEQP